MATGTLLRQKRYENRQADYTDDFEIQFRQEGGGYLTIWVLDCPEDPIGKGVDHHHLYSNGKLCQRQGHESRTLEHAEAFAYWWMKRWSIYIRSGMFPMTGDRVSVPD